MPSMNPDDGAPADRRGHQWVGGDRWATPWRPWIVPRANMGERFPTWWPQHDPNEAEAIRKANQRGSR